MKISHFYAQSLSTEHARIISHKTGPNNDWPAF